MIAFVKNDGSIAGGCFGDSPATLQTITKIPDGCTAMYIDDTQYPNVWTDMGEYVISGGVPVFTPIPDATKLQNAIDAKVQELTDANNNANPTFQSSALGTVHTYLSDEKAMGKFDSEYMVVNSASYDGSPILWYTLEEGGVNHTKDQFNQVYMDGRKIFKDAFANWDSKVKQAKAVTLTNQTLQQALAQLDAIKY